MKSKHVHIHNKTFFSGRFLFLCKGQAVLANNMRVATYTCRAVSTCHAAAVPGANVRYNGSHIQAETFATNTSDDWDYEDDMR